MENPLWCLPASACKEGRGNKEAMASTSFFFWEKVTPSAVILKLDNSVLTHVSVVLFKLLPHPVMEFRVSESVYE